jgi:hypothetical protein
MASLLSQLLRHCLNALSDLSGRPKWKVDARRPPTANPNPMVKKMNEKNPMTSGICKPKNTNKPNPSPESDVNIITDGDGCIKSYPIVYLSNQ